MNLLVLRIFLLFILLDNSDALFDWLFGESKEDGKTAIIKNAAIKFEVSSTDDQFVQEFSKALTEMSPLDACYNIVVFKLKKKCGELAEEELGKLSVQLLNCQSEVEKRPVFVCSEQMSLSECTKHMDGTVWNSYQIVNNRARALCYGVQQHQFRKLTEVTVSHLLQAAHSQIDSLNELRVGQEQLHNLATDTVRKLFESQQELMGNQQLLEAAQNNIHSQVASNLENLMHEKSLIATGNKELADMTENIKKKLDVTAKQLLEQEEEQTRSHKQLLKDLNNLHEKSSETLEKLDVSSQKLLKNHEDMMVQYREMFGNLQKINTSITYLLNIVTNMQISLEERLGWVTHLLGGTDDKLSLLTCVGSHVCYFILAALGATFLNCPAFARFLMVILVAVDAVCELKYHKCLDLTTMSAFILLTVIVSKMVSSLISARRDGCARMVITEPISHTHNISNRQLSPITQNSDNREFTLLPENSIENPANVSNTIPTSLVHSTGSPFVPVTPRGDNVRLADTSDIQRVRRHLMDTIDEQPSSSGLFSPGDSRTSTPQRSHLSTPRSTPLRSRRSSSRASDTSSMSMSFCQGTTRSGLPCQNRCVQGIEYCHRHRLNTTSPA